MEATILTVGSELLWPGREDTNAAYLTERLAALGIPVVARATVGDDIEWIAALVKEAVARTELVVLTGGLGPTSDDRTREAVARALDRPLRLDEGVLAGLRARYARRGAPMPASNERQAVVVEGARVLPNRVGTAPGLWIRVEPRGRRGPIHVVLLPGPPRELHAMFDAEVAPELERFGGETVFRVRTLVVSGLPESLVEEWVGDLYRHRSSPSVTVLASAGRVEIRLTASASTGAAAEGAIEELAAAMRERLGPYLVSETGAALEEVVGALLAERGLRLAVAESCTGGLVAHRITEVPGSSRYFDRGFVTYSNEAKTELLGVEPDLLAAHGAVSAPVARAMARGARERSGADLAVAVTGIAGPEGGTPEKPIGLVFMALADGEGELVRRFHLAGDRQAIKRWSSELALLLVRLRVLGHPIFERWPPSRGT